jgi:hypothetical protein
MPLADPAVEPTENQTVQFLAMLATSLVSTDAELGFVKLSLGKYRGAEEALNKVSVRLLEVKGQPHLSFVYHYQTKDVTKNFSLDEGKRGFKTTWIKAKPRALKVGSYVCKPKKFSYCLIEKINRL